MVRRATLRYQGTDLNVVYLDGHLGNIDAAQENLTRLTYPTACPPDPEYGGVPIPELTGGETAQAVFRRVGQSRLRESPEGVSCPCTLHVVQYQLGSSLDDAHLPIAEELLFDQDPESYFLLIGMGKCPILPQCIDDALELCHIDVKQSGYHSMMAFQRAFSDLVQELSSIYTSPDVHAGKWLERLGLTPGPHALG